MRAFEYAAPTRPTEMLELLADYPDDTAILAGGADLVPLMAKMIVTPRRVVNIMGVAGLGGIMSDSQGVTIGATTTLDELLESRLMADYPAMLQAICGINSDALQATGTIGGELLQRPQCWYFRAGEGLLAGGGRSVAVGDNRYHAIFGNGGPAKFVSPSRVAPALIALSAQARVIGPGPEDESYVPVEALFRTPRDARQSEFVLEPGQVLAQIHLPPAGEAQNATYEIRQGAGPDFPLASAAAAICVVGGIVREVKVVLGQVAPTPWNAYAAEEAMIGQAVTLDTATAAGEAIAAQATPLSHNGYKVQLASVAARRALLAAAGLPTGGFDS
ncbi:MAG TPA: FAD binding domain-containing protein [Pirellulales bacterium]|jgi:xanthine dehydrogenase YagS FAD-binding subunit